MSNYKYNFTQVDPSTLSLVDDLSVEDGNLIDDFDINSSFNQLTDFIELHYYSLDSRLLKSTQFYTNTKSLPDSETANNGTFNTLELGTEDDLITGGYTYGDVYLQYNFLTDPFTEDNSKSEFFIEEISSDRLEIRLLSTTLSDTTVLDKTDKLRLLLAEDSTGDLLLNFNSNRLQLSVNIDTLPYKNTQSVIVRLYNPLPDDIGIKSKASINLTVANSVAYLASAELIQDEIKVPYLKGPNFNINVDDQTSQPSEYFSINEAFNYPVTNSYYEVKSLVEEKGIDISIDYSDYTNFINFSSAEERLRNFKYKVDLIKSYDNLKNIRERATATAGTKAGITGSVEYYNGLINGIVGNFDHYEKFLYFESGSYSWPKTNTNKPYTLLTGAAATGSNSWYANNLISASNYDTSNPNQLFNTVPEFLRGDPDNSKYSLFIHMVGQHFDNLWIYTKALSDKYDGDNRIDSGISKDLIQEALKNFGVRLYSSNRSTQELFQMFTGETYNTGSEGNNTTLQIEIISGSNTSQSEDSYRKHIYKRIYHNLPYLIKTKGTERGLRALFSSFGVPSLYSTGSAANTGSLFVKQYGGTLSGSYNLGTSNYSTSSLGKIRIDDTGSLTGTTLSEYVSIQATSNNYAPDTNLIEIGYSPADYLNNLIIASASLEGFDIGSIIGDPGYEQSGSYNGLIKKAAQYLAPTTGSTYNIKDFTRTLKFFDNVLFKTIKDFIPARVNASTGIIIKPHLLERSKAKQVLPTSERHNEFTSSITIGIKSGSHGNAYGARDTYTSSYSETVFVPTGTETIYKHNHEEPKFNGELSGSYLKLSTGELNDENIFKYDRARDINLRLNFIDAGAVCEVIWGEYIPSSPTPTPTPTLTPTISLDPTPSLTATPTLTPTATLGATQSPTKTPSVTPTRTPANTQSPTKTPSVTPTRTPANTQSPTKTPTATPTGTPAVIVASPTPTPSVTPTTPVGIFNINPSFGMRITNVTGIQGQSLDPATIPSFTFPISTSTNEPMVELYEAGTRFDVTIDQYSVSGYKIDIVHTPNGGSSTVIGTADIFGNGTYNITCTNPSFVSINDDISIQINS